MKFKPVSSDQDIDIIVDLARVIWHEHYAPIIGVDQVTYMLDHYHSAARIREEIDHEDYQYYLIQIGGRSVGYFGVQPRDNMLILGRLYVLSSERAKGYGRNAIGKIVDIADALDLNTIRLRVNKGNLRSIAAYEKMGFKKTDMLKDEIGGGYVMDDYQMELSLG